MRRHLQSDEANRVLSRRVLDQRDKLAIVNWVLTREAT